MWKHSAMTEPAAPDAGVPHRPKVRLWLVALVGAVAMALILASASWVLLARQSRSDVSVLPESLVCNGKPVAYKIIADESGDGAPYPAFDFSIDSKTQCVLTVVVANEGSRSVEVDSVYFDLLAPAEGGPVLEVFEGEGGTKPRPADLDSRTAAFDVGEKLGGGESTSLQFMIRTRAGACGSNGTATFPHRPSARVSAYGLSALSTASPIFGGTSQVSRDAAEFRGVNAPICAGLPRR